jgi:hypothetical protein
LFHIKPLGFSLSSDEAIKSNRILEEIRIYSLIASKRRGDMKPPLLGILTLFKKCQKRQTFFTNLQT